MLVAVALGVAALLAAAWWLKLRNAPLEFRAETPPPGSPLVSVIVPMFNEEQNVDGVLESLRAQSYPAVEVVAVNDRSSDGTGARLAEWQRRWPQLRVVSLDRHPAQWRGKSWPMYHGARAAAGKWLLFLDADLRLKPESIAGTVGTCRACGWDCLGILGRVRFGSLLERVLRADLMTLYLALAVETPHAVSCGHYMLVRRDAYEAAGGWAMVYDEMQDDIALPRLLSENGYLPRIRVWLGSHDVLPYRDLPEAWRAMRRVIAGGAGFHAGHSVVGALFALLLNLLPWLILLEGLREGWYRDVNGRWSLGFAAAIVALGVLRYARLLWTIGATRWLAFTRPLGDLLVFAVQLDAALRSAFGRLEWKGVAFGGRRAFAARTGDVEEFARFCASARADGWAKAWIRRLARESELLRFFFASRSYASMSGAWSVRTQPLASWFCALRLARRQGQPKQSPIWMFGFLSCGWLLAQTAFWLPSWLRWTARRRGLAPALEGLAPEEQRALRGEAFRRLEQQRRPWFQATPPDRKPGEVVLEGVPASGAAH